MLHPCRFANFYSNTNAHSNTYAYTYEIRILYSYAILWNKIRFNNSEGTEKRVSEAGFHSPYYCILSTIVIAYEYVLLSALLKWTVDEMKLNQKLQTLSLSLFLSHTHAYTHTKHTLCISYVPLHSHPPFADTTPKCWRSLIWVSGMLLINPFCVN